MFPRLNYYFTSYLFFLFYFTGRRPNLSKKECPRNNDLPSNVSSDKSEKLVDSRNDYVEDQIQTSQNKELKSTSFYNEEESKVPESEQADINIYRGYQVGSQIEEEIPHDTTLV